jgi:hypothetical protein
VTQATPRTRRAGTYLLEELDNTIPAELLLPCILANAAAYIDCGHPATCVLTAHALAAYLREQHDLEPSLVRVEAHAHPQCRCESDCHGRYCSGKVLGSPPWGERRPATRPGWWGGHLAVTCDGYLLDPTIDQVNNDLMHLPPIVVPLPDDWENGGGPQVADGEGTGVWWRKYYRQIGWKSAGDARPSHWRPVVDLMLELPRIWEEEA